MIESIINFDEKIVVLETELPIDSKQFIDEELPEDLYRDVLAEVERGLFSLVLERTNGKQLPAAKHLGLNRNTLHKKLKALGMIKR